MRLYRKNSDVFEFMLLSENSSFSGETVYRIQDGHVSQHYLISFEGETRLYGVSKLTHAIVNTACEIVSLKPVKSLSQHPVLPREEITSLTAIEITQLLELNAVENTILTLIQGAKSAIADVSVEATLSLEAQITAQYHAKTFELFDVLLTHFSIKNALNFLEQHWENIKSSPLCYTARPQDPMTHLFCQIAEHLSKVTHQSVIVLLMPSIKVESHFPDSFPDLDKSAITSVLQTHILSDDATHLIPIALFQKAFPSLTGDPRNAYGNPVTIQQNFAEVISPYESEHCLTANETMRLGLHNEPLRRMMDVKLAYNAVSTNTDTLLGQLNTLIARLDANSAHGGRGTAEIAAMGAFPAIETFHHFYRQLDEVTQAIIPVSVKQEIDGLINLASTKQVPYEFIIVDKLPLSSDDIQEGKIYLEKKNKGKWFCRLISHRTDKETEKNIIAEEMLPDDINADDQESVLNFLREKNHIPESRQYYVSQVTLIETCIGNVSENLRLVTNQYVTILDTIGLSAKYKSRKVVELEASYAFAQNELEKLPSSSGSDHYGFSTRLLTFLSILPNSFLQTDAQINELMLLSLDEIYEIMGLPGVPEQIIKAIGPLENWVIFITTHQADKLFRLLKGVEDVFFKSDSGIIKEPNDLSELLAALTLEKIQVILVAFKGQIYSVVGFKAAIKYLSPDYCAAVCKTLIEDIPNWIENVVDFRGLLQSLTTDQCAAVCTALIDLIPRWVKSADAFSFLLHDLFYDKRGAVFTAFIDLIAGWIKSIDDFTLVINHLDHDQRAVLCTTLKEWIPVGIKNIDDFKAALWYLRCDACTAMSNALIKEIPDWIESVFDFRRILSSLTAAQCAAVCTAFIELIPGWIESAVQFDCLLCDLVDDRRAAICKALIQLIPAWIKSMADLKLLATRVVISGYLRPTHHLSELKDHIFSRLFKYMQNSGEAGVGVASTAPAKKAVCNVFMLSCDIVRSDTLEAMMRCLENSQAENNALEKTNKNVFFGSVSESDYGRCLSDCIELIAKGQRPAIHPDGNYLALV